MHVSLIALLSIVLIQGTDSATQVAELVRSITPVVPRLTGKGYEHLKYESRMPINRHDAMVILGNLGSDAAAAVPLLSKLINDPYEPQSYRLAMIDALQKIGPASKAAVPALKQVMSTENSDLQKTDSKDFLLSIAAERAILFIEAKPGEQPSRGMLVDLIPLLQNLSATEDRRLAKIVDAYFRRRESQSPEFVIRQFEGIVTDSKKKVNLIVQFLRNRVGKDLGQKLLNSTFIDGKSITKQFLFDGHDAGTLLLESLDGREDLARPILEAATVNEDTWEQVFRIYTSAIINGKTASKEERFLEGVTWLREVSALPGRHGEMAFDRLLETDMVNARVGEHNERLAEVVTWLREVSALPGRHGEMAFDRLLQPAILNGQEGEKPDRQIKVAIWIREISALKGVRRQFAYDWLSNTWATSGGSERVRLEVVETAKRLVDSIDHGEGLMLLFNWQSQTAAKMQFAAQLLPDFRVSQTDREEIAQQLTALTTSNGFDPLAIEKMLVSLIRMRPSTAPSSPPPLSERFLLDGRFADGEMSLQLVLNANPADDEARFGLGVMQFVRAVENLGKALHKYGAVSENASMPFLRLPIPKNESPSTITYEALGQVLDAFEAGLGRAEATLAMIKDDDVKLRLRLAKITFDFAGTGKDETTLLNILSKLNGGRPMFAIANSDFRVHFDRGDVAWLRAYCHLLSALVDCYRALDLEAVFKQAVAGVFPKVESRQEYANQPTIISIWSVNPRIVDAPRLRRMRLHLLAVCELNPETWLHIRKETDDDYEWLAHPKQTDQLLLPFNDRLINGWLEMMVQLEGLLKGERLLPDAWIKAFNPFHVNQNQGLNLQKLLDDPPADLFSPRRMFGQAVDDKYLEQMTDRNALRGDVIFGIFQLLQGPFGFAHAARLN